MAKQKKETAAEVVGQDDVVIEAPEAVAAPLSPQEVTLAPLNEFDQHLNQFKPYLELKINGPDDKAGFKRVESARLEVKRIKVKANNIGDAIVEPFNKVLQAINSRRKYFKTRFGVIEDHLKAEVDLYEAQVAEAARIKKEEEDAKFLRRVDQVQTIGAQWSGVNSYKIGDISISATEIQTLSDERFIEITGLMETEAIAIREQQRIEEERIAAEKAAQEAEALRLKEEADKLQKEKDEFEAKKEANRIASEQALADRARKIKEEDEDRQAEIDRKQKEADDKLRQATLAMRKAQLVSIGFQSPSEDSLALDYKETIVVTIEDMRNESEEWWERNLDDIKTMVKTIESAREKKELREKRSDDRTKILSGLGLSVTKTPGEAIKFSYKDVGYATHEEIVSMEDEDFSSFVAELPNTIKATDDRIKSEEEAKKAKIEALRPDKEKLSGLVDQIKELPTGLKFATEEAEDIRSWLQERLGSVAFDLQVKINVMQP